MMGMVCELCGDIGVKKALICCFKCQASMRHCYCLDVLPENLNSDSIMWACEDCQDVPQLHSGSRITTNTALTFPMSGEDKDAECTYSYKIDGGTTSLKKDLDGEDLNHHVKDCPNVVPEVELVIKRLLKEKSNTNVTRVGAMDQTFQDANEESDEIREFTTHEECTGERSIISVKVPKDTSESMKDDSDASFHEGIHQMVDETPISEGGFKKRKQEDHIHVFILR